MLPNQVCRRTFAHPKGAACAALLLLLGGCSSMPFLSNEPPSLEFTLVADPMLNSCGQDRGLPLFFHVVQVTDASLLTGTTPEQVWTREDQIFGDALLKDAQQKSFYEDFVDPGKSKVIAVERNPKAKYVIFLGNYCQSQNACWYYTSPLKKTGGQKVSLALGSSCVTSIKR